MPKRVVPTVPPLGPEAYAATVLLADAGATARAHALQAGVVPPGLHGAPTLHQSAQPPVGSKIPTNIDPELLALYIEEAREEVTRIGKLFPAWEQNPLETDALVGLRRAFHTLKGSGRMVGATDISEFAWAIENLLNRVIENTLQRSPAILATVRDAMGMAGELVNALEAGKAAPAKAQDIVDRAHALAANKRGAHRAERHDGDSRTHARYARRRRTSRSHWSRADAAGCARTAHRSRQTPSAAPPPAARREQSARLASSMKGGRGEEIVLSSPEEEPSADLQLREIYSRETQVNIAAVLRYIEAERPRGAPHIVSEEAYRACHTLSGSSRMAEARHGIRLSAPLEHWMRKAFDTGIGLEVG